MKHLRLFLFILTVSTSGLFLQACGDDESNVDPDLSAGGMNFGKVTSAVVVVNPVINEGSSTSVPTGTGRSGVEIKI